MSTVQGVVASGAQANSQTTGTAVSLRMGQLADLICSDLQPQYYEQTYRGNAFSASLAAVGTTTVGLATTYTGLCLSNPIGSGVNLVLTKASLMQSVIQSVQVEAYAIAVGFSATTNVTHTAALTPISNKIGSGLSALAKADTSATLPVAPTYHTFVTNTSTAVADSTVGMIDLGGSIILMPGAYACFVTPAQASVAGMWFHFSWFEVPQN